MHIVTCLCFAALATTLSAQSFYIPTNTPSTGTANAFPFNTTDMRYQALIRATELNSTPALITGFALAPSATGSLSFGHVVMKMAHLASPTLVTTFDTNLAAGAITTLDAAPFNWQVTAGTWNEVDLQTPFVYNGVDNVVVEFLVTGRVLGSAMYRDATNQRVYLGGYTGQLTGTDGGLTAFKMRVITGDASRQTFGLGCLGSNSLRPLLTFSGTSQFGQTLTHQLTNAQPTSLCFLALGFTSAAPYPIDLTPFGFTGCTQYIGIAAVLGTLTDGSGAASVGTAVPVNPGLTGLTLYSQWAALDAGAPGGLTVSNYGRALVGN